MLLSATKVRAWRGTAMLPMIAARLAAIRGIDENFMISTTGIWRPAPTAVIENRYNSSGVAGEGDTHLRR